MESCVHCMLAEGIQAHLASSTVETSFDTTAIIMPFITATASATATATATATILP